MTKAEATRTQAVSPADSVWAVEASWAAAAGTRRTDRRRSAGGGRTCIPAKKAEARLITLLREKRDVWTVTTASLLRFLSLAQERERFAGMV
jgi:hypothetical protein